MNIILLASGAGSRFEESGVQIPKPLIRLFDKYFFQLSVESILQAIPQHINYNLIFSVLKRHVIKNEIDKHILKIFPFSKIVVIEEITSGPAESAFICLDKIDNNDPIVIVDCDLMFRLRKDDISLFLKEKNTAGALATFKSRSENYSYLEYDKNNNIINVKEKIVCSDDAIAGIYFFRSKFVYTNLYRNLLTNKFKENYISLLYSDLLKNGYTINHFDLEFHLSFGTPYEFELAKLFKWNI